MQHWSNIHFVMKKHCSSTIRKVYFIKNGLMPSMSANGMKRQQSMIFLRLKKNRTILSLFQSADNSTSFIMMHFLLLCNRNYGQKKFFKKLCPMLYPGGILVTYCSKSDVRRAMQAAGFIIEKIPGPRGKREMVRALK